MSKLTDNLDANFQLFIEEVRESGQVWGLRYGEDWVVCRSAEFEDADVMPLWSAEGDARLHCVDEWADYEPEVIELEEFLDIWINDLDEDDVLVGPNWNADLEGQELLGHQWLSTTSGYIHVRSEHVELAWRNANQRVEARFAEER